VKGNCLVGVALLVLLLPVSTLPVLATEVEKREQELQYIVGEKYTVIIPEKIVLEDADATGVKGAITADVTIKASHEALMIPPETMLQVSIGEDNNFLLTRAGGGDPTAMSYVVKKGSAAGHEIGTKGLVAAAVSGRNDSDVTTTLYLESTTAPKYSGTYTDTLNFSIDVAPYYADFGYTGAVQTFVAPTDGVYELEAWGSRGGDGISSGDNKQGLGGLGGYTKGEIFIEANQVIYIYVGNEGTNNYTPNRKAVGGWNGGGDGSQDNIGDGREASGSGGGATDFRLFDGPWNDPVSLNSRIMVAGGGGGGGGYYYGKDHGGAGGGLVGISGIVSRSGYSDNEGGTQTTGWEFGVGRSDPQAAAAGLGNGTNGASGGGGGGWYGGQTTPNSYNDGGGGGGSSFISGYSGCVAIADTANDTANPRTAKTAEDVSVMTYAGKAFQFSNTVMKAGNEAMPYWQQAGATVTGNAGKGHARVTLRRYTD
jgi:hypothetical protein